MINKFFVHFVVAGDLFIPISAANRLSCLSQPYPGARLVGQVRLSTRIAHPAWSARAAVTRVTTARKAAPRPAEMVFANPAAIVAVDALSHSG
jgi:hypothetical protein